MQNYFAALLFFERYLRIESGSKQTITNETTDIQTAGVWIHWDNHNRSFSYAMAMEIVTYVSYFMLSYSRQMFKYEVLRTADGGVDLSGWVRSTHVDVAS